jgi:hypothetical protein
MNNLITIENDKPILKEDMVLKVIEIEDKIKQLKTIQDAYKEQIKEAMEEKGVIKIQDEISGLLITYIEAKENLEKFNQTKFREEHPELFDEYVTLDGKKSAYITIRIK